MTNIAALKIANARRWQEMKVRPELVATIDRVAARLSAPDAKAHYAALSQVTQTVASRLDQAIGRLDRVLEG